MQRLTKTAGTLALAFAILMGALAFGATDLPGADAVRDEADAACWNSYAQAPSQWHNVGSVTQTIQARASHSNCNSVVSGDTTCLQDAYGNTFACRYGTNQWSHWSYSYQYTCSYSSNTGVNVRSYVYNYYTGAVSVSGWVWFPSWC